MSICKYLAFICVYIDESGEDMTQGMQRQKPRKWEGGIASTNDT